MYCFQGIEGEVLKREAAGGFYIDPRSKLRRTHLRLVLRLAELGYFHDKVICFDIICLIAFKNSN